MIIKNQITVLKKEDFSIFKIVYPSDLEIERTEENNIYFEFKNGEELTNLYLKSDVTLFTCVFEIFIKVLISEFDISPLYSVSLPA